MPTNLLNRLDALEIAIYPTVKGCGVYDPHKRITGALKMELLAHKLGLARKWATEGVTLALVEAAQRFKGADKEQIYLAASIWAKQGKITLARLLELYWRETRKGDDETNTIS